MTRIFSKCGAGALARVPAPKPLHWGLGSSSFLRLAYDSIYTNDSFYNSISFAGEGASATEADPPAPRPASK
ncbi:MAG: hypothetical protein HY010_13005 [Acidobacteria bacterium]|nr:hypothetical protein [Acidobacteriota bacterium]